MCHRVATVFFHSGANHTVAPMTKGCATIHWSSAIVRRLKRPSVASTKQVNGENREHNEHCHVTALRTTLEENWLANRVTMEKRALSLSRTLCDKQYPRIAFASQAKPQAVKSN